MSEKKPWLEYKDPSDRFFIFQQATAGKAQRVIGEALKNEDWETLARETVNLICVIGVPDGVVELVNTIATNWPPQEGDIIPGQIHSG